MRIDPESVGSQWRELGGASTLVLQNEVPKMVSVAAARAARADGSLVILNAAPARPMSADLLDCVDLLIVNRIEAEMLTGKTVQQRAGAFTAMYDLRKPGRAPKDWSFRPPVARSRSTEGQEQRMSSCATKGC